MRNELTKHGWYTYAVGLSAPCVVPADDSIAAAACFRHGLCIVDLETFSCVFEAFLPCERRQIFDGCPGICLCLVFKLEC